MLRLTAENLIKWHLECHFYKMKNCVCEDEKAIFRQQVKKRDRYCMSQPNNTKDVKVEIGDLSLSLSDTFLYRTRDKRRQVIRILSVISTKTSLMTILDTEKIWWIGQLNWNWREMCERLHFINYIQCQNYFSRTIRTKTEICGLTFLTCNFCSLTKKIFEQPFPSYTLSTFIT